MSGVHENQEKRAETPPIDSDVENADGHGIIKTETRASIAEGLSLPHEILFVATICCAQLMTQAGLGQTLTIIHVIGDSFGVSDPGVESWLIAGYSLTIGTFILISGRMGDIFGYKPMLLVGFAWFSLWSMVCGLAVYSTHVLFVFARVFQGIGPAVCLPNGLAILGATYAPGRRKSMVFSLFGAAAPGGCILGAVFASLFARVWWPWTYWSFAIALAGLGLVGAWAIPDPPHKMASPHSLRELLSELDLPGAVTGVLGLVLVNFAWNQAPIEGWQTPYVYATLIIGVLFLGLFFWIELSWSSTPLIPFHALNADVSFVLGAISCGWACFGIWIYYSWQWLEVVRGLSPLLATAWMCPVVISGAVAAVCTGFLLGHAGPPVVMTLALIAFSVGTILMATTPVDQSYWPQIFIAMIITPWGMDMSFPAGTLILSNAVEKKHQGVAASLINTVVNYSISLGLGFAGTIETRVNRGGKTTADTVQGYRSALYMGIGLAGLGIAVCLCFLFKTYRRRRQP
ncbi:MFS general substrate transporter [Thozetella sp. PMI_491]|nr:MFS general substrate transporter [Thozetella sp. PMI_491]